MDSTGAGADMSVGVVYTWVSQTDPERDKYLSRLPPSDENTSLCRYDTADELKYSVQSLLKYCSWVNMIYIAVKDGQRPPFLNFSHPKIELVPHSKFMPADILPVFNSLTIEMYHT